MHFGCLVYYEDYNHDGRWSRYIPREPSQRTIVLTSHFCGKKNRYSSALESWVRWRSCATNVSARSCPGCRLTSGVTYPVRTTRSSRNNAWLSWSSRETWGNTSSFAPGHGGSCGRRSSRCSTSLASRTRWPWVSFRDLPFAKVFKHSSFEGLIETLDQHQVDGTRIAILVFALRVNQAVRRKRQIRQSHFSSVLILSRPISNSPIQTRSSGLNFYLAHVSRFGRSRFNLASQTWNFKGLNEMLHAPNYDLFLLWASRLFGYVSGLAAMTDC